MPDSLSALKSGAAIKGTVVSTFLSGAIVDIGITNAEGFLYELDSPSRHGPSPVLGLQAGQTVTAWVLDANPTTHRVALTLVNPASLLRLADLREGQRLDGMVISTTNIGTFVDVGTERNALLHISEIERAGRQNLRPALHEGATVVVYVNKIDLNENKLSLRLLPKPRMRLADLSVGASVTGVVIAIKDYGAFVDIDAEKDGLLPVREMASSYVAHPSNVVSVNQAIKVQILSVDLNADKFSLTMKQLW